MTAHQNDWTYRERRPSRLRGFVEYVLLVLAVVGTLALAAEAGMRSAGW